MTIWHAIHHLAGWLERVKAKIADLESLESMAASQRGASYVVSLSYRKIYEDKHDEYAKMFNARKFWWMRKIKMMSE